MKKKPAPRQPALLDVILNALDDLKAQSVVTLDVRHLTDVADTLVIASGTSNRQVRALAEHVVEDATKAGYRPMGVEGLDSGEWVLADFADVVVHVMLPETRAFYDLENLWRIPGQPVPTPATAAARPATKSAAKPAAKTAAKPAAKARPPAKPRNKATASTSATDKPGRRQKAASPAASSTAKPRTPRPAPAKPKTSRAAPAKSSTARATPAKPKAPRATPAKPRSR